MGCPIQISTDQRLLAAPRGFSQRATSFIASWCQGIHRMPLSCSRSSGLSFERPSTMHGNHPRALSPDFATSSGRKPRLDPINRFRLTTDPRSAHNNSLEPNHPGQSLTPHRSVQRNLSNASEPSSHKRLDATHSSGADDNPVRLTDARRDSTSPYGPCHHARPETHQNLIHPDKEQLQPP